MPKRIPDLRSRLLAETRRLLLADGGKDLTIRSVANTCQVAVGTVYNYFPSKEVMMGYVILEDWKKALTAMRKIASSSPTPEAGLHRILKRLLAFEEIYRPTWNRYIDHDPLMEQQTRRHPKVVEQLGGVIRALLVRFDLCWAEELPGFLAEILLLSASRDVDNLDSVQPVLSRLLKKEA